MEINNVKVDSLNNVISWEGDTNKRLIFSANVDSYAVDKVRNVLFVLNNVNSYPEELILINSDGIEIKRINPPLNFCFSYLSSNSDGVSIICGAEQEISGHWDWRFMCDFETYALKKIGPAR